MIYVSGPVCSTHGNLYVLLLARVYGRYRVLDAGVIGSGTGEGEHGSGRDDACWPADGTDGTGMTGQYVGREQRGRREELVTSVRDEGHGGGLCEGVERVLGCGDRGTEHASQRRRGLLPRGGALHLGGALPPWTKRRQLPAGDGTAAVACHGVLHCPRQRLGHRGHGRGHQQAAPRGQATCGRQLQYGPSQARGDHARGGDRHGTSGRRPGGHERPFPPEVQALVEGQAHMGHAARGPSGVLPDQLPPGDGPPYVLERVGPGCMPQYVSLAGPVLSLGGTGAGTCELPWEQAPISPPAIAKRERHGPPVRRALQGGTQATTERTHPSGMDIARDLAPS